MVCKQCGADIGKQDKDANGFYTCPGCQRVYKAKAKAAPAAESKTPARKKKRGAKRRRKAMMLRAGIGAAVLILLIAAALILFSRKPQADNTLTQVAEATATAAATVLPDATSTPEPTTEPTAEPIEPASVHFRAVGDIMSHKLQMRHAYQSDKTFSYDSQFQDVRESLQAADYTIGNLELSISADGKYSSFPRFRVPEAILATLKDCGFDLLTMANNHILDGDYDGMVHTIEKTDEYGIDHLGAYTSAETAATPIIHEVNGIKFGFLAYTLDVNGNEARLTSAQRKYAVPILDEADFKSDVRTLREAGAEVVICLPHWGMEGTRSVHSSCKKYAQEMIDAGVDIILGSHPHVVLPMQHGSMTVDGVEKDIFIAWSMGNFISFMDAKYEDSGIIVDFTVNRDANGRISIDDIGYVPVYVWGSKKHFELVRSELYYDNQPEGMPEDEFRRMRQSNREIKSIVGDEFAVLNS